MPKRLYAKPIKRFLNNGKLQNLLTKASELSQFENILQFVLDDEQRGHYRIGNIQNNELILIASNAAWASRMHYTKLELLKALKVHPEFADIKKVRCKIAKDERQSSITSRQQQPRLSNHGKMALRRIAKSITDKDLKRALEHLASGRRRTEDG